MPARSFKRQNLTELEAPDRLGYLAARLNHSARQEHPEDSDCDGDLLRRGAAVVLPESLQEASCPPHIQSPITAFVFALAVGLSTVAAAGI